MTSPSEECRMDDFPRTSAKMLQVLTLSPAPKTSFDRKLISDSCHKSNHMCLKYANWGGSHNLSRLKPHNFLFLLIKLELSQVFPSSDINSTLFLSQHDSQSS